MKKANLFLIWIFSISVIATSCREDIVKDSGGEKTGKLARMNIADAKLLFITSGESGVKLYGVKNSSLLKSTSEMSDEIYEIEYLDENGKPVEDKIPRSIYDAGDFLIVFFREVDGWVVAEEAYFVRKADGAVYEVPNEYIPSSDGYNELIFNSNVNRQGFKYPGNGDFLNISFDGNDNFYYTAIRCLSSGECPHILYRVSSISNSGIDFRQVSAENETVWGFCMDDAGNSIYCRAGGEWLRYVSADGNMGEPIPVITRTGWDAPVSVYRFVWNGTDGIMALLAVWGEYDSEGWYNAYPENRHYLMKLKNGQFEKTREISLDFSRNFPSSYNVFYVQGKVIYSHYSGSSTILVDISGENSYREIPCPVGANIVINGKLYNFDENTFSLTHINIDNGTATPVFALNKSVLNDYVISCIMDVTESSITFGAYRLSDKMNVVAKIGLDNVPVILQSNSGEVSLVAPLNP
ncbi:MAG: hypothetical protein LBE91_07610 [Tannerella sp.]|nr:hypothetical protein [Tannerella sp.]